MVTARRILIVDDNKEIHRDFQKVFQSIRRADPDLDAMERELFGEEAVALPDVGHVLPEVEIDSAYQGEEGIRLAVEAEEAGRPYDMAFVDVRMPPGIDGVETINRLWKQLPDLQCVICTAFSDYDWEEIIRHLGKAGNLLILKKPFDAIEVLQLAQSLAEKTDLTRAARKYQGRLERQVEELTAAQAELCRYNEKLVAARTEAEKANRTKSEFLANVSHELRTPLNAVIGMTELLMGTRLDAQQQRFAAIVKSSGETLLELIDEILDFAKIEAGKLELESIEFHPTHVVEPVIELVAHKCRGKQLELVHFLDPAIPPTLLGDPARLRQILTNLANNAVKFTERGAVMVRAELVEELAEHATVRFTVRDTGIGIPADRIDRLFEAFSQVDASTTRKYGGTGLGLAISRQLCHLMDGEIGVESTPGEGSTFWFTVRLRKADASVPEKRGAPAELQGVHALLVDGTAASRDVLCEQLCAWGLAAQAAGDADEAAAVLEEARQAGRPFRLVLAWLADPLTDGQRLAERLGTSETKLVALVALETPLARESLEAIGFVDAVTLPIMQAEVFAAMLGALDGKGRSADDEAGASRGAGLQTVPRSRHAGAHILIAEDNCINQDVAVEILTRAGYECEVVGNGRLAIEAVGKSRRDLVLMDLQMPEMGGLDATRAIREGEQQGKLGSGRRMPIVALTANAMKEDREICLAAGMNAYLSKPLNPLQLIETIEKQLDLALAGDVPIKSSPLTKANVTLPLTKGGPGGSRQVRRRPRAIRPPLTPP
ncbi:MAG: response regulator [Planctomycetes bacterium]|nr:response regulator [Planctomycetota bacterium]